MAQFIALVADDSAVCRMMLCTMLEKFDFLVYEAKDGAEAVKISDDITFDFVFMDCDMPVMSGCEAAKIIKSREGRQPPIIAITANDSNENRCGCADVKMDDFIVKPVSIDGLRKILLRFHLTV